jgi:hypothetical protein
MRTKDKKDEIGYMRTLSDSDIDGAHDGSLTRRKRLHAWDQRRPRGIAPEPSCTASTQLALFEAMATKRISSPEGLTRDCHESRREEGNTEMNCTRIGRNRIWTHIDTYASSLELLSTSQAAVVEIVKTRKSKSL